MLAQLTKLSTVHYKYLHHIFKIKFCSRGCAQGRQRRWKKPGARPRPPRQTPLMPMMRARWCPPNPADADDVGPLGASATHSKIYKSWGNGCETRACSARPPGEVPSGPVEKRGSAEAGRRHWRPRRASKAIPGVARNSQDASATLKSGDTARATLRVRVASCARPEPSPVRAG